VQASPKPQEFASWTRAADSLPQKYFVLVLALSGVVAYYITKSPKYLDDGYNRRRNAMNTTISTKLTALALALVINSMIMGSVALMFNTRLHETSMQTASSMVDHADSAAA
jgi:hypothetical protein